jgi:hypothetical protein
MSITVNPRTPLITGVTTSVGAYSTAATANTIIIAPTTAQSILDFSKLVLRFENVSSFITTLTPVCGTTYSEICQGNGAAITLGTSGSSIGTVIVGGASFESARFQDSSGKLSFAVSPTATTVYIGAFMLP